MEPRHDRSHRNLEGGRDVTVRHLLDVEEDDGLPRALVQIGESPIEAGKLLSNRGLVRRARRRRFADGHGLHPGLHRATPPQIQAEAASDGDEPRQDRPFRIESLEVDEGPHKRVLREILGLGGSEQSPAEAQDGPMKAPHQLVEGSRIAAVGATRKIKL